MLNSSKIWPAVRMVALVVLSATILGSPPSAVESARADELGASSPPGEFVAASSRPAKSGTAIRFTPIGELKLHIEPPSREGEELPEDSVPELSDVPVVAYGPTAYRESFLVPPSRPAGSFCYGPLYFEELSLERYGRHLGPAQPAISAAHFFATLPALPYLATARRPYRCYHFDYPYEAGRHAPFIWKRPPLSPAGGLMEAGVITGLIFLIP